MTPADLNVYFEGQGRRLKRNNENQDYLNHILGNYIAYAFNDPKHYPKKPALTKETTTNKRLYTTDDALDQRIRAAAKLRRSKNGHN